MKQTTEKLRQRSARWLLTSWQTSDWCV